MVTGLTTGKLAQMAQKRLQITVVVLLILLLAVSADETPMLGPVVNPGEVSTYLWTAPPLLEEDSQQWTNTFYETYNFTPADYTDAMDMGLRQDDVGEVQIAGIMSLLGENETMAYAQAMALDASNNGALRVASTEAKGCPNGCWVPTHRLPRVCECVLPVCDNPMTPDECHICQRGYGVYRTINECMSNGDDVEDEGLAAADYPPVPDADQESETMTMAASLCPAGSGVSSQWDQTIPDWSLTTNSTNGSGGPRKLLQTTDCPHLQPGLSRWEDQWTWPDGRVPQRGSEVAIPPGKRVLLSVCSLNGVVNPYFKRIYIPESSELVFADTSMALSVSEIKVDGALKMGSPTCRLKSPITITFRKYDGITAANFGIDTGSKSTVDVHGVQFRPTWTRLAATGRRGDTSIKVKDPVQNWAEGQRVVLVTTAYKDLQTNQNEVLVIRSISKDRTAITFTTALQYDHYGGPEYQAEVGLLSRTIQLLGSQDTVSWGNANEGKVAPMGPWFGPHIRFIGRAARISGTYIWNAGQTNQLGHYSLHFHLMGQHSASTAFVTDSAIHESNFRGISVHGTNGMLLQNNVAFWITGNCFYLETGAEERNVFDRNMVAYVLPMHAIGGRGQAGAKRTEGDYGNVEPADAAAAAFYGTNTYNTWTNNAGSGGFFVYSFPVLPRCIREFAADVNCKPMHRPFIKFEGNTAHSAGYLWEHGACLYTGGMLTQRDDGKLVYSSGREMGRDTLSPSGHPTSLEITNFKAFLCQVGIGHWGSRMVVRGYEVHDMILGAQIFGDGAIVNAIFNARTPNRLAAMDTPNYWDSRRTNGFIWYDTSTRTILSNIEFHNFKAEPWKEEYHRSAIFSALTESDFFTPHVMSYTKKLKFTNCDLPGVLLRLDKYDSNSYRQFQWIDTDGTASGLGGSSIIGSEPSFTAVGNSCKFAALNPGSTSKVFICKTDTKLARLDLIIPGVTERAECCGFPADSVKYGLGMVFQMGYTGNAIRWTTLTRNARMVGPTGKNGWYFAFAGNACPKAFNLHVTQVPADSPAYVSLRYPPGTTFAIKRVWQWASSRNEVCRNVASRAAMVTNNDSASGCVYHWDGRVLYLKISEMVSPPAPAEIKPYETWTVDGVTIINQRLGHHWFEVSTSLNCGEAMCKCDVQPDVPPAMW